MSTYSLQEEAVFAAGPFWEAEEAFRKLHGVIATDVGYAGGSSSHPTAHDMGDHVEAVRIYYDQRAISFEELLKVFWKIHDPTRRVEDRYDTRIMYVTDTQKHEAENSIREKRDHMHDTLITHCEPLARFWPAEEYHQHYLAKLREEG